LNGTLTVKLVAFCLLTAASIAARPAHASSGCSEFRGSVDDQTKGEGGSRVGEGFGKGDTLTVTIDQAPGHARVAVNLLEYASPDGPFRALVEDRSDSFTYRVPAPTRDFIYLNFSGPWPGMIVTWGCTPATIGGQRGPGGASARTG
jgi:hypothetical protein